MGRTILITGASSGIGFYACKTLSDRGYRVVATVRSEQDRAALSAHGIDVVIMDLADTESVRNGFDKIIDLTGGDIYALFNNGYFGLPGAVEDLGPEALKHQFDLLFGTFYLIKLVIPIFRRKGHGRIVQNSSVLAFCSLPFRGAYGASKAAMESLSDSLRREVLLHPYFDLKISILEPGPIDTKFRLRSHLEFSKYICKKTSYFVREYEQLESRLSSKKLSPGTLPPSAVVSALLDALENSRPKRRYMITFTTKACFLAKLFLPGSFADRLFAKLF